MHLSLTYRMNIIFLSVIIKTLKAITIFNQNLMFCTANYNYVKFRIFDPINC